jgi:hypothetical protein
MLEWFALHFAALAIIAKRHKIMTTPAERRIKDNKRKKDERDRNKAKGLVRGEVKAHAEDWAEIRALELKLRSERYD